MTKRPVPKRRRTSRELGDAAALMRDVLAAYPADNDRPVDAAVRRRVEGAVIATELAAGEQTLRVSGEGSIE